MNYFAHMEAQIPQGGVRTRFAPSPTGYMHVGNLRTALYTWLIARHLGGTFLLRIEDTDQGRLVEGATDVIYKTLAECGLTHDEGPDVGGPVGPYVQSQRRDTYLPYAKRLVELGHAYYCFCEKAESEEDTGEFDRGQDPCRELTHEEVQAKLDAGLPWVIRQKIPQEGTTTFHDEIFGDITVPNDSLDDQVLLKRDGLPTYNFANVIDDHLMGITHVMRGMEYLSSTPKYNLLYNALGWEIPKYIHMPPVMRDEHHKLSKRDGDAYYSDFIARGFLSEAIVNYLALVGWNPGTDQEFFTMEELIRAGYRKFAFISGLDGEDTQQRYQALRDTLEEHGIEFKRENYFSGDYREKSGYQIAKLLMLSENMPEILVCANDNMAIGAIKAFRAEGGLDRGVGCLAGCVAHRCLGRSGRNALPLSRECRVHDRDRKSVV